MNLLRYPIFYCVAGFFMTGAFYPVRASWWGLAILSVLILLYAFMAQDDEETDRSERGDNCYFIGFVYTLLVITMSLILDADALLSRESGDIAPMLKTVGIALGTSVVGMTLRFYFSHGAQTPENQFQKHVRSAAAEAYKMAGAANEMVNAAKTVSGAMSNYSQQINEEAKKVNSAFEELFQNFADQIRDALQEDFFEDVKNELKNVAEIQGQVAQEHLKTVQATNSSIQQSIEKLKNAAQISTANAEEAQKAIDSLDKVIGGERWEEMNTAISRLSKNLQELHDGLDKLLKRQTEVTNATEKDVRRLQNTRAAFEPLLKELQEDVAKIRSIKENYRREFEQAAASALKETHKLYATLIAGAETALQNLDKTDKRR